MSFGERLKVARDEKGYTQSKLAELVGYCSSTISEYEKDNNKPNLDTFINLCKILDRDANYFLQDYIEEIEVRLNPEDQNLIDKYNVLTHHDREIIDYILNMKKENIQPIIKYESIMADDIIYFPLVNQKASAGIGEPTHQWSNDLDKVCFPINQVPEGTTHAIIIDGYSMEPQFFNNQIVFINAEKDCNDGDYGIFQVTTDDKTDVYCKQLKYDRYGRRYLHSVSERSDDPEFIDQEGVTLKCIGKILI